MHMTGSQYIDLQEKILSCILHRLCHCQKEAGRSVESRKACSEAIKIDDEPRLYCDRAEAFLLEDMFDEVSAICVLKLGSTNYIFRL